MRTVLAGIIVVLFCFLMIQNEQLKANIQLKQKITICKIVYGAKSTQKEILNYYKQGYTLTNICSSTSFREPTYPDIEGSTGGTGYCYILVFEK